MKRILVLLCFVVVVSAANAQVVKSSSNKTVVKYKEQKQKKLSNWYIKAGLGMNEAYSYDSYDWTVYKFDVGFRKLFVEIYSERISLKPYWGMDFGLGHRFFRTDYDYHNYSGHNIQWSPNIGIDIGLSRWFSFDLHLGPYLGFDYSAYEEYSDGSDHDGEYDRRSFGDRFDIGINVGIGFWINRVNLEFAWQKAFTSSSICNILEAESSERRTTQILLFKLGYKLPNLKGSGLKVRKAE